jgi:hypothetical protein
MEAIPVRFSSRMGSSPTFIHPILRTTASIRSLPFVKDFFLGMDETVIVNGDVKVTVIDIDGDEVTLAIDIPEWMGIGELETFYEIELASKG